MALSRPALQALGRSSRLAMNSAELPEIFRPPVNRSMRVLDRSFFQKTLSISAATVFDDRNLSIVRGKVQSAGNLLSVSTIKPIIPDETVPGRKCVLLRPGIMATGVMR
jgi:tRNA (guanine37-N1)-methyltransferase